MTDGQQRTAQDLRVLRQLGLNADLSVIRERSKLSRKRVRNGSGQSRTNVKKKRRTALGAQCVTTWNDLPTEIQLNICRRLDLLDLHAVHLSGLYVPYDDAPLTAQDDMRGLSSPSTLSFPSHAQSDQNKLTLLRSKVQRLEPFRTFWLSSSSRIRASMKMVLYTPVDFVNQTKALKIRNCPAALLACIHEFHHLHLLDISRYGADDSDNGGVHENEDVVVDDLPLFPTSIVTLRASRCQFISFPNSVLYLHKLLRLDLSHCTVLEELPHDIGVYLRRLCYLSIIGCTCIKSVPMSLLRSIEKNATTKNKRLKSNFRRKHLKQEIKMIDHDDLGTKLEDQTLGDNVTSSYTDNNFKIESELINEYDKKDMEETYSDIIPLLLTETLFEREYLQSVFSEKRFPIIVNGLKQSGSASFLN